MIDTHCHLLSSEYEDVDDLICKVGNENIRCIVCGYDTLSSLESIELSNKYDFIYSAIGIHPSNITSESIDFIRENINKVVAIGEIGLDYHYTKDNIKKQIELFEKQLKIAEEYNKPVIVHTRDSIMDVYNILKKYNVKGVIHAFSGSLEMANKFIDLGFKLGIGGVITFKNCNLKSVIKEIDLKHIILETDSPYLTPEPNRGKVNSPLNLKFVAQFISELKEIPYEDVCNITTNNAVSLFDLKYKI